jgi:hypothetical protein
MNADSDSPRKGSRRARWIAAGFLGAFAASVLTVIFTGLMVEQTPENFDAGFRSVTLRPGEIRSITLVFDVPRAVDAAQLELNLPDIVVEAGPAAGAEGRTVSLLPGDNEVPIEIRAVSEGSGYLVARIIADEPLALERVFVTVAAE